MRTNKNQEAWIILFSKHAILDKLKADGIYSITSEEINTVRQSRLMSKFDHLSTLPKLFAENNLAILPVSRSSYVIGYFDAYFKLEPAEEPARNWCDVDNHESLDFANLYSENAALLFAFNAGIINDLLGEDFFLTVLGRMSSGRFTYKIHQVKSENFYSIDVDNSQCEIDAGFESENFLLLIEAKMFTVEDFLVRQIYYPYRLWQEKVSKKVIPALLVFSNDIFSFFVFEFDDPNNYNSIRLVTQRDYTVNAEHILREDVNHLFAKAKHVAEPSAPFPQADNFERVIDLVSILRIRDLSKNEITENYAFNERQVHYYTSACMYLGLVKRIKRDSESFFSLTEAGSSIAKKQFKYKHLDYIEKIFEHRVFLNAFELACNLGRIPSIAEIAELISKSGIAITGKTIPRRAQTVKGWTRWIWKQISD
jgi:hypothetical protein